MISHMASIPKTFFHINVHRHTIVGKVVLRWYDLAIHSDPRLMEKFRMSHGTTRDENKRLG